MNKLIFILIIQNIILINVNECEINENEIKKEIENLKKHCIEIIEGEENKRNEQKNEIEAGIFEYFLKYLKILKNKKFI
jgi:hypothetical protein